jgi:hypothetical protein
MQTSTLTTSTVFKISTWNFKHMFVCTFVQISFCLMWISPLLFAWYNKILWRELLLQFLRYWLETWYICSTWSVDVRDIFFVWISPLFFAGDMIKQNRVMQTSTVLKISTWNQNCMFCMKCVCQRHIFLWISPLFFAGEHYLTKSFV